MDASALGKAIDVFIKSLETPSAWPKNLAAWAMLILAEASGPMAAMALIQLFDEAGFISVDQTIGRYGF